MPCMYQPESSRRRTKRLDNARYAFTSLQAFLLSYLVKQPLAAVATVWLICFPLLYYVYNDLAESASTMLAITGLFLIYLMTAIALMVVIALAVEFAFSRGSRWLRRP